MGTQYELSGARRVCMSGHARFIALFIQVSWWHLPALCQADFRKPMLACPPPSMQQVQVNKLREELDDEGKHSLCITYKDFVERAKKKWVPATWFLPPVKHACVGLCLQAYCSPRIGQGRRHLCEAVTAHVARQSCRTSVPLLPLVGYTDSLPVCTYV